MPRKNNKPVEIEESRSFRELSAIQEIAERPAGHEAGDRLLEVLLANAWPTVDSQKQ